MILGTISLFTVIGLMSLFKNKSEVEEPTKIVKRNLEEIPILETTEISETYEFEKPEPIKLEEKQDVEVDRIQRLFALDSSKLPIVETVTYTSRVPWLKDRPAWIADYAKHYETSRHFIARSLNAKPDYFNQNISPGDQFNVIRKDLNLEFYLLIDLSKCKMRFYCYDKDSNEKVLLKTYPVGLGRKDSSRKSGYLTPTGKYILGNKVAIYKEGIKGYFQDKKIEMIQIFGTRWIPFEKEVSECSERAKGFGLHGSPWTKKEDQIEEDRTHIGKYDSDGCVRLNSEDIEEIFSIIITKPSYVVLVNHFDEGDIPGVEKENFSLKSNPEKNL